MKQRITIDQLNELSKDQIEKLRELWVPREGDIFRIKAEESDLVVNFYDEENGNSICFLKIVGKRGRGYNDIVLKRVSSPLLSIGQMIELLDPDGGTIFTSQKWIAADPPIYEISVNGKQFHGANMCDCLWEAVKQIL